MTIHTTVPRAAMVKALKIELPDSERGMAPERVARWEWLTARLRRADLTKAQRERYADELAKIESRAAEAGEAEWRKQAKAETIALAEARGEEVVVEPTQVRIKSRDGLQSAGEVVKDGLSRDQYDAGRRFRDAWEARSGDLGSQMGAVQSGGGGAEHNNDRFTHQRLQRAKKLQWLGSVERRVALECLDEPACLQMLRAVAGEGHSLSSFGEGRAYARHMAALKRALDVVADKETG